MTTSDAHPLLCWGWPAAAAQASSLSARPFTRQKGCSCPPALPTKPGFFACTKEGTFRCPTPGTPAAPNARPPAVLPRWHHQRQHFFAAGHRDSDPRQSVDIMFAAIASVVAAVPSWSAPTWKPAWRQPGRRATHLHPRHRHRLPGGSSEDVADHATPGQFVCARSKTPSRRAPPAPPSTNTLPLCADPRPH